MPPREEDAEKRIRNVARKLRDSRPDTERQPDTERPEDSFKVETDESVTSMKRQARGPSLWERARPMVIKILAGAIAAALGTGGGVVYQGTRPPPSVIEVRRMRGELAAVKAQRETDRAVFEERTANLKENYKEAYSQLRKDLFEEYRKLEERTKSLEAYKAEKEAEARRRGR